MSYDPSEAQWAYIERLCVERHPQGKAAAVVLRGQRLTRDGAGKVIDALRAMPVLAQAAPAYNAEVYDAGTLGKSRGNLPYNRYSGTCVLCGVHVAAQCGTYRRGNGGKWETLHLPNECPQAAAPSTPGKTKAEIIGDLPDGFYAVPSVTGSNDLSFLRIGTNKGYYDPSKKGQRYVRHIVGGEGEVANITLSWIERACDAIRTLGVADCQALYGQEIGECGRCGKPLTDATSRARGFGPECIKHVGS